MTTTSGSTSPNGAGEAMAGTIVPIDITNTMQDAYLDYAMSVIVARALPDVRDGLKPVHRRILYAMYHDLGLTFNKPHKKSARIVGEVLGKYHPHGDTAVYDAMVRMAQDFSLRYPLIDGQGNFGSIDGDNAAAMRYTEARLAEISDLMLADLEKDTVEWGENFDNSLREPTVLPAALPNLLINGASGIAVGMATNVPPHNLGEVVDALSYMIDHYAAIDEITVEHLTRFIHGPDFPTGGILYRFRQDKKGEEETDAVTQGYSVGKARLIVQAKAHFEEMSRSRSRIVITELPYQTNKTALIERIATLVRDGKIEGITDLRDESDRTGMRIVIELTRNVDPKNVLTDLFKYTPLQQTFGMQMLALVDGQPRLLSLKRVLHLFIQHREEIIRRRSEYELIRAKERAHILEGLLKALDILDEVIATIRKSQRVETARTNLMKEFGFTEIQAQAILDMQLRRLAALERKKLQLEYEELLERIAYLEDLLAHPEKILGVIKEDLQAIKEKYGDPRRTQIVDRTKGTLTTTDLLPEQDVWVAVGANGELHRQDVTKVSNTTVKRSAKGSQVALLTANTRDYLYLVEEHGQCRRVSIHELPQDGKPKHLAELTEFSRRDAISAAFSLPRTLANDGSDYLFFVTELGMVKRVAVDDFMAASGMDPMVMNVDAKDRLRYIFRTDGEQDIVLVNSGGKAIRFAEGDVRSMGLAAGGVAGIKLGKGQRVVYAGPVDPSGELLTATEKGFVKRTPFSDYPTQGRNGGGVVTHKLNSKTGNVSSALAVDADSGSQEPVVITSRENTLSLFTLEQIPQMGRGVQGRQIVAVGMSDTVAVVRVLHMPPEPAGPNGGPGDDDPMGDLSASGSGAAGSQARAPAARQPAASAKSKPATDGKGSAARKQVKPRGRAVKATTAVATAAAATKGAKPKTKAAAITSQKSPSSAKAQPAARATATKQKSAKATTQQSPRKSARPSRAPKAAPAKSAKADSANAQPSKEQPAAKATAAKQKSAKATTQQSPRKSAKPSRAPKAAPAKSAKADSANAQPSKEQPTAKSTAAKQKSAKATTQQSPRKSAKPSRAPKAAPAKSTKAKSTKAPPVAKATSAKKATKQPAPKNPKQAPSQPGPAAAAQSKADKPPAPAAAKKKAGKLKTVTSVSRSQNQSGK